MSQAKGERLSRPELFDCTVAVADFIAHRGHDSVEFKAVVEAAVKLAYHTHFVSRLKTETALKRAIGKTKWEIHLYEYTAKAVI